MLEGSSVDLGSIGSSKGAKKGKRVKGMNQSQASQDSIRVSAEPSLDSVMEKIRKHQGAEREWTDESLRDLAKSR